MRVNDWTGLGVGLRHTRADLGGVAINAGRFSGRCTTGGLSSRAQRYIVHYLVTTDSYFYCFPLHAVTLTTDSTVSRACPLAG
jgi:hypothetical protein